jgi:hypothetical protein
LHSSFDHLILPWSGRCPARLQNLSMHGAQ